MKGRFPPQTWSLLSLLLLVSPLLPGALPARDMPQVRGITISTHRSGQDWGSDGIVPAMEEIRQVGANWISIHPYARIHADGSVSYGDLDPENPPPYLLRPIREAHRLGLKICIIPHLAYWGSPFSWKGEIVFSSDEQWARFWVHYGEWIARLAAVCREADGFVVGTELDRTLDHEAEWRALIARVRQLTDAPLSYASNWTDYHRVPFWDALDVIGIQAYFPLTDKENPTLQDMRAGWARIMAELHAYAAPRNRRILFTELGYNQSFLAPREPWDYRVDGEAARPLQEACWQAALEAIAAEPRLVGAFLWKWFPHPRPVGRNFPLATPPIKRIIASAWAAP